MKCPVALQKRWKKHTGWIVQALILALLLGSAAGCLGGCGVREKGDEEFRSFTETVFLQEMMGNVVSLHYTLAKPEDYGIDKTTVPTEFGQVRQDKETIKASAENRREALLSFDFDKLDLKNKITYEVMNYDAKMAKKGAEYLLYAEPLATVGGVQTEIPVLLSEYSFRDRGDVESYLELMKTTGDYFGEILAFEKEKSKAGLFMSDSMVKEVQSQCQAFLDLGEANYLYSTFARRIQEIGQLNEKEKSDYIQENASIVEEYVFPAYRKLKEGLEELKGTGKNQKGLKYLEKGKEYYEYLVKRLTGSDKELQEIKEMVSAQIKTDAQNMGEALRQVSGEANQILSGEAERILSGLEAGILKAFPELPETKLEIKYVPEEMQEHLSPAFYMIPEIDQYDENVIYLNGGHITDRITLFTTLAHEGYPGHLYQTVYYENTKPDPIRSTLYFGGYVEGWATYAEMCSYSLMPLTDAEQSILQKNSSIILGLYALADLGIHDEGWSKIDTIQFFRNYGISDTQTIERIYDLIIGSPANYLKYYVGYLEFLELKQAWADKMGSNFSQKEFHRAVLCVGPAPFEIVERYMWEFAE